MCQFQNPEYTMMSSKHVSHPEKTDIVLFLFWMPNCITIYCRKVSGLKVDISLPKESAPPFYTPLTAPPWWHTLGQLCDPIQFLQDCDKTGHSHCNFWLQLQLQLWMSPVCVLLAKNSSEQHIWKQGQMWINPVDHIYTLSLRQV